MSTDKPDPRLSEIVEARRVAQSRIAQAVRKELDEFRDKTGLVPEGVDITIVGHYTQSNLPDGYLLTDVKLKVRY